MRDSLDTGCTSADDDEDPRRRITPSSSRLTRYVIWILWVKSEITVRHKDMQTLVLKKYNWLADW